MFTFLEDEGVDDVAKCVDHVTPQVEDATNDNAKQQEDANRNGEIPSPEPLTAATDTAADTLVTSSPAKSSEDVADLEFRGITRILQHTLFCLIYL